ncbi:hypothetical protein M8J76_016959 [Diaphorina citri]|nr:hypothetical protein M8J76_016959 [Diaphorina citri]
MSGVRTGEKEKPKPISFQMITKDQNLRESNLSRTDVVNKIVYDVKNMKGRQESFDNKLSSMKQENEALWRELSILRQKHMKQQQIVNKLINFLVSLVQPSRNGLSVKKMNLPMIKGRREHTDSFCSDDSNYDSITMMDKVQVMSGDEHDNSPPGPTIHELDSPDFLEDIDILQGTDNTLTSPLSVVEQMPSPEKTNVDVNLLSSNTENNPLLLDLVKDVITEEETLVSLPPEQILPADIKTKTAMVPTVTTNINNNNNNTTSTTTKRPRTKKSATGNKESLGNAVNNVFIDTKVKLEQSKNLKNGQAKYPYVATSEQSDFGLNRGSAQIIDDLSMGEDESLLPIMDVNLIKVENSSPRDQDNLDEENSSPPQLGFDTLNCFAETPSPGELDLHCSLSSSPPNPSGNPCVPLYKSPTLSLDGPIGRSESYQTSEHLDSHVNSIQNDLDSLKDIMKGEGLSLDASTLLNLFETTEPLLPPFKNENSNSFPGNNGSEDVVGNELITYAPNIDFSDMFPSAVCSPQPWTTSASPATSALEVNTPLCPSTDDTPSPSKRRRK